MSATLTLGCNSFDLTPTTEPVKPSFFCGEWTVSSTDCSTLDHLTVLSKETPTQTIVFSASVNGLTANVATGVNGDGRDNLVFQGDVTNSRITTGNPASAVGEGDSIKFDRTVIASTITTSIRNDTVVFCNSTTNGTSLNTGVGSDSIQFASTTKVGPGTVINLGANDNAADTISVAAKATFAGSGIVINRFDSSRDRILAPGSTAGSTTVIRSQAEANAFFGSGSVTLNA